VLENRNSLTPKGYKLLSTPYKKLIQRKSYSEEFKKKTVSDFFASKQSITVFSCNVKIEHTVIRRWIKKYNAQCGVPIPNSLKKSTSEEIVALWEEIATINKTIDTLRNIVKNALETIIYTNFK